MKKILFYIDHRNRGGAQRVMVELANYFSALSDYKVVFATQIESSEKAFLLEERVKEIVLKDDSNCNFITKQMNRVKKLDRLCKEEKPDVIISFLIITNIISLLVGNKLDIPVLISVRNDPTHDHSRLLHCLMRITYPKAAGWVFQTQMAKDYFEKWVNGESAVIVNPLSKDVLQEIQCGKITGENNNSIIAVGRLDCQKRHDLLIKAYYNACGTSSDTKLVIYGEGPLRQNLESMIESLGLQDKVFLPGVETNIVEKIRSAKMFVMSSDYEGMPNALLEAMAIGLPVVSTDCPCGGPRELIVNEHSGLLTKVGDEIMLSEKISYLLNNEDISKNLAENATYVRGKCDIQEIGKQWKVIIDRMM